MSVHESQACGLMQMIKPVANAELSSSDNRALKHPSWRLNLSGFQQLRGAGDGDSWFRKERKGGGYWMGMRKKMHHIQVSAFFKNRLSPGEAVETVPLSGERTVCLPTSCCSLACLPTGWGFNFACWPILSACLGVSFHSQLLTDLVLCVNALQNVRVVLGRKRKDQSSPLCSPSLAPICSIHTQFAFLVLGAGSSLICYLPLWNSELNTDGSGPAI